MKSIQKSRRANPAPVEISPERARAIWIDAQRLNVANTYLADLKRQYAGHGTHLAMVGEVLQSMINLPPSEVSPGSDRQSDPRL